MKNYLKILLITLGMQIGWIALGMLLAKIPGMLPGIFSEIMIYGFFLVLLLSIGVDIVLSIKWGKSIKEKLLCIFLMPTNYTWALIIWLVIWYFTKLMEGIGDFFTHWPSGTGT